MSRSVLIYRRCQTASQLKIVVQVRCIHFNSALVAVRIFHIRHDNADEKSHRTRNAGEKCFRTYLVSSGGGNGWREPGRLKWSSFWFTCRLPPLHCSPAVHFHTQPARMHNNFIVIFSDFSSPFPWASWRGWFYACCLFSSLLMRFFRASPGWANGRKLMCMREYFHCRILEIKKTLALASFIRRSLFLTLCPSSFRRYIPPSCPFSSTPVTPPTKHSINTHKPPSGRWPGPGFQVKFMRYSMIFSLYYLLCTVNVLGHFSNWMYCMLWSWFGVRHTREFYSLQQSFILAGSIVLLRMDGLLAPAISPVNCRFQYTRITVDYLCLFAFLRSMPVCVCVLVASLLLCSYYHFGHFSSFPNCYYVQLTEHFRRYTSTYARALHWQILFFASNPQTAKPANHICHSSTAFCQNTKHAIAGNELYVCAMALHFNLIKLTLAGTCRQTMGHGIGC